MTCSFFMHIFRISEWWNSARNIYKPLGWPLWKRSCEVNTKYARVETFAKKQVRSRAPVKVSLEKLREDRRIAVREYPPSQRLMEYKLNMTHSTTCNVIRHRLAQCCISKSLVNSLLPRHNTEYKTNYRKVYERHLGRTKLQYVIIEWGDHLFNREWSYSGDYVSWRHPKGTNGVLPPVSRKFFTGES